MVNVRSFIFSNKYNMCFVFFNTNTYQHTLYYLLVVEPARIKKN